MDCARALATGLALRVRPRGADRGRACSRSSRRSPTSALFQSGIEITSITATVIDKEGHPVTGLEREAFEVYEDGVRQTITQFTRERVPIGLGVLLDISDSMFGKRMDDARAAVDKLLFELLDPADEFFLMAFNHKPHAADRLDARAGRRAPRARRAAAVGRHRDLRRDPRGAAADRAAQPRSAPRSW